MKESVISGRDALRKFGLRSTESFESVQEASREIFNIEVEAFASENIDYLNINSDISGTNYEGLKSIFLENYIKPGRHGKPKVDGEFVIK